MVSPVASYRYVSASRCEVAGGRADLLLATSGGDEPNPRFFDGLVADPRQAAQALLMVAKVARTRFETGPTAAQRQAMLDPIVTAGGSVLRFESFSGCCGVYCRFDMDGASLADAFCGEGTTNVNFNPPMRQTLGAVTDRTPLRLGVGVDEVAVSAAGMHTVERKVPLPERWVRGLAEVQVELAGMVRRLDLGAAAARRFLQALPARPTAGNLWAVPAGDGIRIGSRGGGDAVSLAGTHRLRLAAELAPGMRGLRVYAPPPATRAGSGSAAVDPVATSSAWEILLDDTRLWIVLSPHVYRGFSGEGGGLFALALGLPGAEDAASGCRGFDLASGRWFARTLPFDRSALAAGYPRLQDARALVAAGAVELTGAGGARVRTEDAVHRVALDGQVATCTCPWFAKYRGERGPCKHVLAAAILDAASMSEMIEMMEWPAPT